MPQASFDPHILCFGEVLWDMLPEGKKIGGAPLNVAYHLKKLGVSVSIVSRVGADQAGDEIAGLVETAGLDASSLQKDTRHQTGRVQVTLGQGQEPTYDILRNVAWDFITYDQPLEELAGRSSTLVFGTLASRNIVSFNTLLILLEKPLIKVMDLNLRLPFYTPGLVETLLGKADLIKMNQSELHLVSAWFHWEGDDAMKMEALRAKFGPRILVVTAGPLGVTALDETGFTSAPARAVTVTDTVGSGDAFLAGFLSRYLAGRPLVEALQAANTLGAFVAQRPGGCPPYDAGEISWEH